MTRRRSHGEGSIKRRGATTWRLRYRSDSQRFSTTFHGNLADARKSFAGCFAPAALARTSIRPRSRLANGSVNGSPLGHRGAASSRSAAARGAL
jgi:hypothetical protein